MRMQAAACATVISFRTEPGNTLQHLWSAVATYAMDIRVWESQRNQISLVLTFITSFFQLFCTVWCSPWWQCSFILGFPQKHVGCLQKSICHPASRGKVGTSEYFHKQKIWEKMQIPILSQSDMMFIRHTISSQSCICKQSHFQQQHFWVFFL